MLRAPARGAGGGTVDLPKLESFLEQTLEDGRLSRQERGALRELFSEVNLRAEEKSAYLNRMFRLGKDALSRWSDREVLNWLLDLSKVFVQTQAPASVGRRAEAYFEPKDDCAQVLMKEIDACRRDLLVCVFTLTDNRICRALLNAHRRGVRVRVITDDQKSTDRGSDVLRLAEEGVGIKLDHLPDHMHHKFAVFDGHSAVTGSYNWTRGAADKNHENILLTDDPRLVRPFIEEFERLWQQFGDLYEP